ncbi:MULTISPECIES: inorganic phosphate transporter [Streptomyces]|uniref:Phosphate transporter n=2 Tax=Streptomyces diastaticus group TaxID=2849069 RepID=A0A8H9HT08_9ACTN|nr:MULTISPECIES: inorganic phosphate transporter [Streptomyces]NEE59290.1 inorganic phosphate transporter [Streptomyces sp. SID8455]MBL3807381.1 inorganic phosphate transporter [Streptomyces sp. BRB081]NEC10949.1 inorganic phosphate transporter [Streptomyces sp. SID8014]PJM85549.1 phosphate transporter [Streptomyces sp. TSRI0384-2]RPK93436.1 Low-affinity inorganic phosphate transporter 1 [Streptomyces sp. ADI98-12]
MEHITLLLGIVIVTALVFDFTNGFHDTANAMATTISTGAMRPKAAVAMSAVLNLVGAFLSVEVAKTISGGLINEDGLKTEVIFAALVGAILWNLLTWLVGLPSSSSHALFGGLIGAAVMSAGWSSVNGGTVVTKVLLPALAAPIVAGLAAMLATRLTFRINRNVDEKSTAKGYRAGQIASAGLVSLAHGTNDAQKTMGVITLALVTGGVLAPGSNPPLWVIVSAGVAIALGTYLGGWRIIRTMGKGLTDLTPPQGFAAQTSAATVILASSHLGFSLSTTQSCSGAVMGAGLGRKGGVVRWSTATRMFVAWGLTLPAAALVGAAAELLTKQGDWGVAATAVLLVGGSFAIWLRSRRSPVTHDNVNDVEPVQDEPAGVVTQAMASVAPPPTGAAVASDGATVPASGDRDDDGPAGGSPLPSIPAQPGHPSAAAEPARPARV